MHTNFGAVIERNHWMSPWPVEYLAHPMRINPRYLIFIVFFLGHTRSPVTVKKTDIRLPAKVNASRLKASATVGALVLRSPVILFWKANSAFHLHSMACSLVTML